MDRRNFREKIKVGMNKTYIPEISLIKYQGLVLQNVFDVAEKTG